MKLAHYQSKPNYGDALNPFLAPRVFGNIFDDDDRVQMLFIGTMIRREARCDREIIIGAGAGYQRGQHVMKDRTVFCVRGPLTCKTLGIDTELAAIDPAITLSRYVPAGSPAGPSFMPHHHSHSLAEKHLRRACGEVGLDYISPLDDVETVTRQISASSVLITEALHGSVVAESYGVPWIPVIFSSKVLEVKWKEFCLTIGNEYRPIEIGTNVSFDGKVKLGSRIKYSLGKLGIAPKRYRYLPVKRLTADRLLAFERKLKDLIRSRPAAISNRSVAQTSIRKLDDAIDRFLNSRAAAATG